MANDPMLTESEAAFNRSCRDVKPVMANQHQHRPESQAFNRSCRNVKPVMARIHAYTPHLAKRVLIWDLYRKSYFVKGIRLLPDSWPPFDQEEWRIS